MSERNGARFEGMVLAKLSALEERMDETLDAVRAIEKRCMIEHASHASLTAQVHALSERIDFNRRMIWSGVAWIVAAAAGMILTVLGLGR